MRKEYPLLSHRFDLDDIRKLREYNSMRYSRMTDKEVLADIEKDASKVRRAIACYREMKKILAEDDEGKDPNFPALSPRFDLEDIRKLREYNSLRHCNMSAEEMFADIDKDANKMQRAVECLREARRILNEDDDDTSASATAPEPALEEQAV